MLIPRVIPCLLLDNGEFVKTRQFKNPTYVGDPVNVINLFNRFEVDEIALLDIRATLKNREPDFELLEKLASECWVPLAYGGGIKNMTHVRRIFGLGVEKIILNTAAEENPNLVQEAASIYGSQAVVVSVDIKKNVFGKPECRITSGTRRVKTPPVEYARRMAELGAGEILLMSIDRDGEMVGYDLSLIGEISSAVSIPVIACGGAASRNDLPRPIHESGASAVAAGSLFVYQGPERGVLINFPERPALEALLKP